MIRVMIVEDDPMVAELNKMYLEKANGFQLVATAATVEEAICVIDSQEMDLILLDIFMPGKQGLELLTYLRKNEKEIDVIVISAASDMGRIQKALRYGAADYLIKPFEFERFNRALTTYQEKLKFIQNQQMVSQEELDQKVLHREEELIIEELPKGLTKDTLKQIWEAVRKMNNTPFSTEDIVKVIGISRVSVRKYLKFLNDIGVLEVKVTYGTVGRPVYQYTFNPINEHRIKSFW
jgi:two-component system, CitB family, response regulator MalR